MRFFHLADLHLGRVLHGYSLIEDQRYYLDFLLQQTDLLKPDAVVIAGDIYDKAVPGIEASELFDRLLTGLAERNVHVLIISGNHDSAARLGFGKALLQSADIHLITKFTGSAERVILTDEAGEVHFHLMPFIRPGQIRAFQSADEIPDTRTWDAAFSDLLYGIELKAGARHVLAAHQFFVGQDGQALLSDSEQSMVGSLECLSAEPLERFDYVCLGHLHRAQRVRCDTVRYAGSPLVYSASELDSDKPLSCIDLDGDGSVTVRQIPFAPLRPVRQITGSFADLIAAGAAAQARTGPKPNTPAGQPVGDGADAPGPSAACADYLYIRLTDDLPIQDAFARLKQYYPYLLEIRMESLDQRLFAERTVLTENPQDLSLPDLFGLFYSDETGKELEPAWRDELNRQIRRLTEQEEASL